VLHQGTRGRWPPILPPSHTLFLPSSPATPQAAAPSLGIGRIKARDNPALYGTDREYSLRTPDDPFYKRFSAEASRWGRLPKAETRDVGGWFGGACLLCLALYRVSLASSRTPPAACPAPHRPALPFPPCRFQICIDVFAFGSSYMDLPSLGALPKYTGGQLYYYPGFNAERDGGKLHAELRCGGVRGWLAGLAGLACRVWVWLAGCMLAGWLAICRVWRPRCPLGGCDAHQPQPTLSPFFLSPAATTWAARRRGRL